MSTCSRRAWSVAVGLNILFLGAICASTAHGQTDMEKEELIAKVAPSVAKVIVELERGGGHGSGYVVDESGTVITNAHVIKGAQTKKLKRVYVTFPNDKDKKQYETEGWIDVLPVRDLALVRFKPAGRKCKALKLAPKPPRPGETILTFGSPIGFDNTPAFGNVTAYRTGSELQELMDRQYGKGAFAHMGYELKATWVQHTAPISGGNSGGPLLNMKGEVLGLNTWAATRGNALYFATSAENIRYFMAGARKIVQQWSTLPDWKGAGEDGGDSLGDAKKTFLAWRELNKARYIAKKRVDELEERERAIPRPDPRSPIRGQKARTKKRMAIFQGLTKAYEDYAAQVKAVDTKYADPRVILHVINEALVVQAMADACSEIASSISNQEIPDAMGNPMFRKCKTELQKNQAEAEVLRALLCHIYGVDFPTVETTGREVEKEKAAKKQGGSSDGAGSKKPKKPVEDPVDENDPDFRTWTDRSGKYQIRAKYIGMDGDTVKLEKPDGKILRIPLARLSEADQRFIKEKETEETEEE